MRDRFKDRTVFITGASSGIGAALAVAFAREGANVAIAARRRDRLDEVGGKIAALGRKALPVVCDVTDRASIDAAVAATVAEFGGIDVVVANAGFGITGAVEELCTDDFRRQFETNFFGVLDTVYAVLPHLVKSRGRLGIISSVMARVNLPRNAPYCTSKFAVGSLADCLWFEMAPRGVSVTHVLPGLVDSEIRHKDNQEQYMSGSKDPAPGFLVMPAERAARIIVNAMYRRKPEVIVTFHGKAMAWLARHFPRVTRFFVAKTAR